MSKALHYLAIILTDIALILITIGEATNYWVESDTTFSNVRRKGNFGLWRLCTETSSPSISTESCGSYEPGGSREDKVKVTAAFTIMAIIALSAAAIDLLVVFKDKSWIFGQIISACCAVLFLIIGLGVFTNEYRDDVDIDGIKYGYSFILTWLGFVLASMSVPCGIGFYLMSRDT